MRYLADTTFLIDLVNGDDGALNLALELDAHGEKVGLSTISVQEYLRGVYYLYHENKEKLREKLTQAYEDISAFHIIPYTIEIASKAAEIEVSLTKKGTLISLPDILIAATAIINNLTLLTRNTRDFKKITGLTIRKY